MTTHADPKQETVVETFNKLIEAAIAQGEQTLIASGIQHGYCVSVLEDVETEEDYVWARFNLDELGRRCDLVAAAVRELLDE